jgi:hypothetical protein
MVTRISVALLIGLTLCAVAAVGVLTHRGMAAHSFSSEAQPVELCDELECMLNSGSKPPGVIPAEPRTLTPEELEQMKAALAAEQNLEAEVRHSFTNGVSSMRKSIHFGGTKIPGVCRLMMIERSLPWSDAYACFLSQVDSDLNILSGEGKVNIKVRKKQESAHKELI